MTAKATHRKTYQNTWKKGTGKFYLICHITRHLSLRLLFVLMAISRQGLICHESIQNWLNLEPNFCTQRIQ
ncbi:hypothetical protein J437_LFUL011552 [Ladona fulva]|uniref:Uncharacterized protein n=1 Tax=Ladona fulva TaxID=123851 RepID=A0A8K0P5D2_LADFU|nr:hypothetical protein J437_LFUL011552 [Ladona fulva]